MTLSQHGYVRVAAISPVLALADPIASARATAAAAVEAAAEGASILVFPEMGLSGYTCHDLFQQRALLAASLDALRELLASSTSLASENDEAPLLLVGMPLVVDSKLFNCAVVIQGGRLCGVIPKTYLPTYGEFYDYRYFASAREYSGPCFITLLSQAVPFSPDLLFEVPNVPNLTVGVEICEDAWAPIPRCSILSVGGATLIANLSASNELIGKAEYRRDVVVRGHAASCLCGYVYASAGPGESTTDTVFGGHCLVAEGGSILAEGERFLLDRTACAIADIDIQRMAVERQRQSSFNECIPAQPLRRVALAPLPPLTQRHLPLRRGVNPTPFVPTAADDRTRRCEEIFRIQTTALARRSNQLGHPKFVVGVSGGLDSTLAMLVCHKTLRLLRREPGDLVAVTMPGFGTSDRTKNNAVALTQALTGKPPLEVDIRAACRQHLSDIKHPAYQALESGSPPDATSLDVAFENVQARERTQVLMDISNRVGGIVIGTGDLSEMALGWSTYNGDHMSMYAVNCSIPKTLIQYVVNWAADVEFSDETSRVLHDVLATPISPELLPTVEGKISQETEAVIGPYVLHDFFLFHFMRAAASPAKIALLADQAFHDSYDAATIRRWLKVFLVRFFNNQFKRSCIPDGPKVGTVSLSPRADWRMPSDALVRAWLDDLETASPAG